MKEAVRHWFEKAVEVAPEYRVQFLRTGCPDESVCSEVLSLLEYDTEDADSSPAVIRNAIESLFDESHDGFPVQRVGPFQLGRLLGSGGMGLVYEAHRVDGEVRQKVAVKFAQISPAASSKFRESVHRRFARERQMLASLRHPYIAGLIDAGTTSEGIPYAVIEQVDGVPIDSYCDACVPDRAGRVRLLLQLCDAVQFAHGQLVVHSDIKPDNILVTGDGIPKLIDFGLASNLGAEATLSTMRAFTPGYASPEQCQGLPATVATDVYGLGAVLYRLLTGAPPSNMQGGATRSMSEDVRRPSAIKPELKGDLENILLKALQPEPQRRYGSVPEFADDLRRFLESRPVRATPNSVLYRARRFMRRHWPPVGVAAVLIVGLAIATVVSTDQRRAALARAAESRKLAETLLFEIHDEIDDVLGGTRARERLGVIAVKHLEQIERDHGRDPELAWELLNAYSRLAQSRGGGRSSIGDTPTAWNFAAKALELGRLVETSSDSTDRLDRLFVIYDALVAVFEESGHAAERLETIDRMLRLSARLDPIRHAQALKQRARYLDVDGSRQHAHEVFANSLAILRTLARTEEVDSTLISTLVGFGRAQALAGEFPGAAVTLQEAVQVAERRIAAAPQMARSARQLYWSHIALGDVFGAPMRFSLQRPLEAASHYRRAQAIAQRLVNADPANETTRLDLVRAVAREGAALTRPEPAQAVLLFDRAQSLAVQTSPYNHSALETRLGCMIMSIEPLARLQQHEKAGAQMREAHRLADEMRAKGAKVDERSLLRAEAVRLYAVGRIREALAVDQKHLAMLSRKASPTLSENFATMELLERIRTHAGKLNSNACASATLRLANLWTEIRAHHPNSAFVRHKAERSLAANEKSCDAFPVPEQHQYARLSKRRF